MTDYEAWDSERSPGKGRHQFTMRKMMMVVAVLGFLIWVESTIYLNSSWSFEGVDLPAWFTLLVANLLFIIPLAFIAGLIFVGLLTGPRDQPPR